MKHIYVKTDKRIIGFVKADKHACLKDVLRKMFYRCLSDVFKTLKDVLKKSLQFSE